MRDLGRLLRPDSIAVVGGGAWGRQIILQCRRMGFTGSIQVVHPTASEIDGIVPVRSVADLAPAPDAVFIGVNREATIDVVRTLSEIGAGGAVCFASGFSEAMAEDDTSAALQERLVAQAGDMPILGPNCYGFINALDGALLWPDQHACQRVERGVAILAQSSNIAINLTMQRRGLPIAYMITCGNMAQTSQAELARALLDDPRVTAIGVHVEGFGDPAAWYEFARAAAERNVQVVALKVGRSEEARRATVSHTASLAGGDAGAQALLDYLGFARAEDLPSFLETLKLFHMTGRLEVPTLSAISCSGGEAALVADLATGTGLRFPALTDVQRTLLRKALGPRVALANPLDYHTYIWRDTAAMCAAWTPMAADHIGLTLIIVDYPHTDATDWACATQAAIGVRKATGRPVAVVATLPELMPETVAEGFAEAGVIPFCGLREAIAAARFAALTPPCRTVPPLSPGPDRKDLVLLDEAEAKRRLFEAGLSVPRSCQIDRGSISGVELDGPVAVKTLGLAHKTDLGGVALNVPSERLAEAIGALPGDRFLVEEMVTDGLVELLVGVVRDPAHGFVLTIGAGGTMTEILQDSTTRLLPVTRDDVADMLRALRIGPLFEGYRGRRAASADAVAETVLVMQDWITARTDRVEEIEINPLIVTPARAVAADALIRMMPEGE